MVFKTWLPSNERLRKVVHQSPPDALGRCISNRDLRNIWNHRENTLPPQSLSASLCCNWQTKWIPWVLGLRHQLPRVRSVSRLREQSSILANHLDTKSILFSVTPRSSGFTSVRMPCPCPAEERSRYFFFRKGFSRTYCKDPWHWSQW